MIVPSRYEIKSYSGNGKAELVAAKEVLELAQQAKEIFMSSKLDEKQQLLGFFFSNLKLNRETLDVELREPFKNIANLHDQTNWRPLVDVFLNGSVEFDFSLQHIQTTVSTFEKQSWKQSFNQIIHYSTSR